MTRRQAREQAFVILFEKSFHPETELDDILEISRELNLLEVDDYASDLARKTWDKLFDIDELIEKNSIGWRINRISKVSLAILRLAVCEMLYIPEVPVSVSSMRQWNCAKSMGRKKTLPLLTASRFRCQTD
jgi:N utilization substance protein B